VATHLDGGKLRPIRAACLSLHAMIMLQRSLPLYGSSLRSAGFPPPYCGEQVISDLWKKPRQQFWAAQFDLRF
jgi:hypothetical protein